MKAFQSLLVLAVVALVAAYPAQPEDVQPSGAQPVDDVVQLVPVPENLADNQAAEPSDAEGRTKRHLGFGGIGIGVGVIGGGFGGYPGFGYGGYPSYGYAGFPGYGYGGYRRRYGYGYGGYGYGGGFGYPGYF